MKTVVSAKGRITIPKPVRDRLGIRPGQVLDVTVEGGRLVARKLVPQDATERVYGIVKLAGGTDRAVEELRGRPDATVARR